MTCATNSVSSIKANYKKAFESFIKSPQFEQVVITATHADHYGNSYYVQLLSDATYIVGYRDQLFTEGMILVIPALTDDEYDWDEETSTIENPFTWNVQQMLREAFDEYSF